MFEQKIKVVKFNTVCNIFIVISAFLSTSRKNMECNYVMERAGLNCLWVSNYVAGEGVCIGGEGAVGRNLKIYYKTLGM